MKKIALITGITGQDGSYLVELLLAKGYEVHGIKRYSASANTLYLEHKQIKDGLANQTFRIHYGDLSDTANLTRLINEIQPNEIYNIAAQSHVGVSFQVPEYTANIDALGALRILEAIRLLGLENKTRFYQASTSELFGKVQEIPQSETTPFYPRSPYGVAKLYAYWITVNYREAYNIYACNGILFNHESPRRNESFVTRKITKGLSRIALGLENCLYMGNIDAKRDWGHAKDYVQMQWLMLQQSSPEDFVIATGKNYSVRTFIKWAASALGIEIEYSGTEVAEVGIVSKIKGNLAPKIKLGQTIIRIDPKFYRPTEVDALIGDPTKAKKLLGWEPKISAEQVCLEMIKNDYDSIKINTRL